VVLTVGKGILYNIISTVLVGVILSLGSAVSAIAIIAIVYRKKKDAERKLEDEAPAIIMKC
jgi:hypothetical protein